MSNFRSPLSRVKGLGSAKDGTSHFWHQRLTALLLIPLALWFGFGVAALPMDYTTLVNYVQNPAVTVGLILLIVVTFYHAQLGLQMVIEDYVPSHAIRTLVIILTGFICLLLGISGVVAVLKITFGA